MEKETINPVADFASYPFVQSLCVVKTLDNYLNHTKQLREKSFWIKHSLGLPGIDTNDFCSVCKICINLRTFWTFSPRNFGKGFLVKRIFLTKFWKNWKCTTKKLWEISKCSFQVIILKRGKEAPTTQLWLLRVWVVMT